MRARWPRLDAATTRAPPPPRGRLLLLTGGRGGEEESTSFVVVPLPLNNTKLVGLSPTLLPHRRRHHPATTPAPPR